MTLAAKLTEAIIDQITADGGLVRAKVEERIGDVLAAAAPAVGAPVRETDAIGRLATAVDEMARIVRTIGPDLVPARRSPARRSSAGDREDGLDAVKAVINDGRLGRAAIGGVAVRGSGRGTAKPQQMTEDDKRRLLNGITFGSGLS